MTSDSITTRFNQKYRLAGLSLSLILLLGAFLRFYQLGAYSLGNAYYAATVQSMLTSWHNFFYAAYEPGGSVMVDKPPLGFWVQAASAYVLGVNGFALAMPQALAGTLSIPLLYVLVRRYFGVGAGLIAALVLATMPVTISTERNNTIDGLLLFALLLAAWAFIAAVERGRLRYLLLGALLVGLGFNIKMMQAILPLPAFYAFYMLGAPHGWWQRIRHLILATILLLVVSLAWAIAVDLTPPDSRPYVGSSTNNTVMELIVGHNGFNRLFGGGGPGGPVGPANGGSSPGQPGQFRQNPPPPAGNQPGINNLNQPPLTPGRPGNSNLLAGRQPAFANGAPAPPPRANGGPQDEIGSPGPLRLFTAPLSTEAGWLLPLALLGIPLVLAVAGWQWPPNGKQLALVLWGGWLLTELLFFSVAHFYHAYYLIMLGPPIATLVGASGWAIWQIYKRKGWLGWSLLALPAAGLLGYHLFILRGNATTVAGATAIFLMIAGLGLLAPNRRSLAAWPGKVGLGLAFTALVIAPLVWSGLTTFNSNPDVALPRSGPDNGRPHPNNDVTLSPAQAAILEYVQIHNDTGDGGYLLAAGNSHEASPFILATKQPVLTFGGFNGGDNVIKVEPLAQMVSGGELRYVLGRQERKPEIAAWLEENCAVVTVPGLEPSPPPARGPDNGPPEPPQANNTLFDCGLN